MQQRLLDAVLNKRTPEMTADAWSPFTVSRLGVMLNVANAALAQAADRATAVRGTAMADLVVRLVLLATAVVVSLFGFRIVSRQVTGPLQALRVSTEQLARGDLSAASLFPGRQDEIGALARALDSFRDQALAKARIEDEQRDARQAVDLRRVAVEDHIDGFQKQVSAALAELDQASGQMERTSATMLQTAERSAVVHAGVLPGVAHAPEAGADVVRRS